jgi:hypothetical protein
MLLRNVGLTLNGIHGVISQKMVLYTSSRFPNHVAKCLLRYFRQFPSCTETSAEGTLIVFFK